MIDYTHGGRRTCMGVGGWTWFGTDTLTDTYTDTYIHRHIHRHGHSYRGLHSSSISCRHVCPVTKPVLLPRYISPTCACAPVVQVRIESAPTCRKYPAALRQPLPAPPIPQSFLSIVPTPGHYLRQSRPCFPRHQRWKPGQDLRPSQRPAQRHSRCREKVSIACLVTWLP